MINSLSVCPVCYGKGFVPMGFYNYTGTASSSMSLPETCRACGGSGVIKSEPVRVTIDMSEAADMLTREHKQTAMELLTLIKHEFFVFNPDGEWTTSPGVQQILKLYSIDHHFIK